MEGIIWQCKRFDDLTNLELYQLLQLRNEVFIVEQSCPYQDLDEKDFQSLHLFGRLSNELVAYARIVFPKISYKEPSIGRVVTKQSIRGNKVGETLMFLGLQIIENNFKTTSIRISAQSYLKAFYRKFGFQQITEEYLEDNLPHIEMLRD